MSVCSCRGACLKERGRNTCPCKSISGDLAVVDPDGYLHIKDRSKDVIISGGENISSIEIENVLYSHPQILEAAVAARPDNKWGETPCAFVHLRHDAEMTESEVIQYCRDNMAHFKCPKNRCFWRGYQKHPLEKFRNLNYVITQKHWVASSAVLPLKTKVHCASHKYILIQLQTAE